MVSPPPPPPAPLDLPEPSSFEQRSLYRPHSRVDPPFHPPSNSLDSIPTESSSAVLSSSFNQPAAPLSPIERSETPPPPLRNLANKFANMINLNTAVPIFGSSAEGQTSTTLPQSGPRARAHGRSQSLGYFFGASIQPDQETVGAGSTANASSKIVGAYALPDLDVGPGLSGEEIERLAKEERDWSRREAEKLMRTDKKDDNSPPKREPTAEGKGPRRLTSSRSMRNLSQHQSTNPLPSAPSTVFPMPSTTSAYLVPDSSNPSTLDIPGTLALLAKRFEKLETWSVGHVKALEDRVGRFDHRLGALEGKVGREADEVRRLRNDFSGLRNELENRLGETERRFTRSQETQPAPRSSFDVELAASHSPYYTSSTGSLRRTGSTASARSRPLPPSPCPPPEQFFQQHQQQYQQPFQSQSDSVQQGIQSAPFADEFSSFDTHDFASAYNHSPSPLPHHNDQQSSNTIDAEEHVSASQHLPTPTPSPSPPSDRPRSPIVPPRKRYTSALSSRPPSAQGNHTVSEDTYSGLENLADDLSASRESSSNSTSTLASSSSVGILGPRAALGGAKAEGKSKTGSHSGVKSTQGTGPEQSQADQKEVILASNGKRAKVGAIVDFWDKGSRK
ncbi:hypothetical protein [Phaffia rhodozyma]|uniref:Uncharacterized protein n=1 Tax=Phaffia rhodozyma TaxID=264483 RepID=A0A0F7SIL8_PHARH|nr:hypothetical protein [Phaffia rhodozyma]